MKTLALAAVAATLLAAPAFAQTDTQKDASSVASDVNAIHKDNKALSSDDAVLAKHRAEKVADKANGNMGAQAVDSTKLGWDHVVKGEKSVEKDNIDKPILNHDAKELNKDTSN